jgi:hypothetical protein
MIELYNYEQDIKDLILSSLSIAYTMDVREREPDGIPHISLAKLEELVLAENEQPDLYYIDSILVTLGWNLNDDIFLREEVVRAKNTPVDKPFNRMHNQDEIIGHMTSSRLLDSDYGVADESNFEHVAVNSVIYKAWRDKEKKEEILQTISEIQEGKWKVSMECLFNKFDYGIILPDGSQKIIERNAESSYLTKHLRAYKGSGTYNGNKIGRVLRNITFCGKGLVDKPGNPYSLIFNKNKKFFGAIASLNQLKENEMNEAEKAEFEKAKADLLVAQAALAELQIATAKESEVKLTTALAEKDSQIAALQSDIGNTTAKLAEANEKVSAVETAQAEILVNFEKAKAELTALKAEKTVAARKDAIAKVVKPERVEALLAKVGGYSDEIFASFIESLAEFKPPWLDKEKDKTKEKETKAEDKMAMEKDCKAEEVDFSKASLDEEPINGTSLANDTKTKDFQNITNFVKSNLTKSKKGDK